MKGQQKIHQELGICAESLGQTHKLCRVLLLTSKIINKLYYNLITSWECFLYKIQGTEHQVCIGHN